MIVQIILAVIGVYALRKKEIKVSSKRIIRGKQAVTLGWVLLIPVIVALLADVAELILKNEQLATIIRALYTIILLIVIIWALYLVIFYKNKN